MTGREQRAPEPRAARRERQRRKARYGMRVKGAGARLLGRLAARGEGARKRRRARKAG